MLECVVNVSEGRDRTVLDACVAACGDELLDTHTDPHHHRTVFTLLGEQAPRRLAAAVVELVDLAVHEGVHPRFGGVDVVPFVPLGNATTADAVRARDAFCAWAGETLDLPCFRYGPERSLPEVRRDAFGLLPPDCGPDRPHPRAGACAVGARDVLIAYNVWVTAPDLAAVRKVAAAVRRPSVRTLGLAVGDRFQVSCNLVDPQAVGPAEVTAAVAGHGASHGVQVRGCELVGLVPEAVLAGVDPDSWEQLDLGPDRTIEHRIRGRVGH